MKILQFSNPLVLYGSFAHIPDLAKRREEFIAVESDADSIRTICEHSPVVVGFVRFRKTQR